MREASILIVGGGPAGATTALLLARRGHRVSLLERRADGEGKCCGGCVAPRAVPLIRRLGIEGEIGAAAGARTRWWRLLGPDGEPWLDESLGGDGVVVDRAVMDASLRRAARRAGAAIGPAGPIDVMRCHGFDLVIGADGVGSGVARAFGLATPPSGRTVGGRRADDQVGGRPRVRSRRCFGFSWSIDGDLAARLPIPDATVEIRMAREGYLGVVRMGRRVLAAVLVDRARIDGTAPPAGIVRRWLDGCPALRPLVESLADAAPMHATGPLPWRPARVSLAQGAAAPLAPGVALVGDAAGYEEPFTGEGMAWAFESAELLATHVHAADRWDAGAAQRYAVAHRSRFSMRRRRLRWLGAIGAAAARRPAVASLLRAAGRMPFVPGAIVRSVVSA